MLFDYLTSKTFNFQLKMKFHQDIEVNENLQLIQWRVQEFISKYISDRNFCGVYRRDITEIPSFLGGLGTQLS